MSKKLMIVCVVFLLSGCGQSGPLYLPKPPKPAESMPSKPPVAQAVTTTTSLVPEDTQANDVNNSPLPVNL